MTRYQAELYHYGVKGMKWGIRRWQREDGSLTPEGKKRYRQEYREDNRRAFELGRDASITSHALYVAKKKAAIANNRYEKHPTDRNKKRADRVNKAYDKIKHENAYAIDKAKRHISELMAKYGSEAVKGLSYDKRGRITESVTSGKERVRAVLMAGLGTAAIKTISVAVGGIPTPIFAVVPVEKNPKTKGTEHYYSVVRDIKKEEKRSGQGK